MDSGEKPNRFVNIKAVAFYLSLTESTIRAWVRLGKIPFYKIGRAVRFDLSEIDKWVDKKKSDFMSKSRLLHFFSWFRKGVPEFDLKKAVEMEMVDSPSDSGYSFLNKECV